MNISEILKQQAAAARVDHVEIKRAPDATVIRIRDAIAKQNAAVRAEACGPRPVPPVQETLEKWQERYDIFMAKLNARIEAQKNASESPVVGLAVGDEFGGEVIIKKSAPKTKAKTKKTVEKPAVEVVPEVAVEPVVEAALDTAPDAE